jgi:hypothetical protein
MIPDMGDSGVDKNKGEFFMFTEFFYNILILLRKILICE